MLQRGPTDPGVYHVYSLCYAQAPERRVRDNFMMPRDMHDGPMPLDYNVWLLRNAERTILVDTGYGPRAAAERHRPLDRDPIDALAAIGIPPDEVTDVLLTHLHYDHAGNLDRLPRARFHVQDKEVAFATGRCMCHQALRFAYDVEDVLNLVRYTYAQRVCHHDGMHRPFPGIELHPMPGHTRGLQSVRVQTPRGPVVLASDASHFYANMLLGAPFVLTVDAADTLQSYADLLALAGHVDRIIPGHDPEVRNLYRCEAVNGVDLTVLHEPPRQARPEALTSPAR